MVTKEVNKLIETTYYIDHQHKNIQQLLNKLHDENISKKANVIKFYYYVRDHYAYNPYHLDLRPESMKASYLCERKQGYCIEKALILSALCRAIEVPTRLGFGNVRNHLGTSKLEAYLGTDLLVFHGYLAIFLNGDWVKCTPAFNKELCEKLGVDPLEFDGENDSIFQESDKNGNPFMEYVHFYGDFADMPLELFEKELHKYYPILWEHGIPNSYGFFHPNKIEMSKSA